MSLGIVAGEKIIDKVDLGLQRPTSTKSTTSITTPTDGCYTSTRAPPPPLNHNSFLYPLNDNSISSFSNPLIIGGSQEGERAKIEPSRQRSRQRAESTVRCRQQMLHGPTEVTVAVMIVLHHTLYPPVAGAALLTKAKTKAQFGRQKSGQGDKQTLNPFGPHAAHWSNYIGEVVKSVPLYYPSWEKVSKERKAAIISEIGTLFDLRPHMDSSRWTEIYEGINMHLQKAYNTNKASFKAKYWKADPTTGSYDLEAIRRARPEEITAAEWDKYIKFWNDPKNLARAAQNRLNRQKSVVTSRQGSRSLARLRDEMAAKKENEPRLSRVDSGANNEPNPQHDLADSDVEDLINVDDDGVEKMSSADVARSHGGDGGGDDRPPSHVVPTGCGGCFANKGKGKRKPNLGGRGAGRLNTRDKTRNLSLKEIAEAKGPVSISFEQGDKQTLNPLGPHAAHWSNYIGEVVRSVPLYYPSWEKVPKERKAAIISEIGTLFDLRPHMDSSRWTEIYEGINMHLQKAYNTNKASFKAKHWKADPTTGTYDVEAIRRARPDEITAAEWDKYIKFWNDPKNLGQAAQNRLNRQKSIVISRQGSRSLARLRDEMRQASDTQEYPSLIDTFWRTHTLDGEESEGLEAKGQLTEDEINALHEVVQLVGHIPACVRFGYCHHGPHRGQKRLRLLGYVLGIVCVGLVVAGIMLRGGRDDDEEGGNDEDGEDEDDDGERIPDAVTPAEDSPAPWLGKEKPFPSDMSLGKGSECRQGRRR
ncbi:F-box domain containing protein, partial [Tanacetum coccineum]